MKLNLSKWLLFGLIFCPVGLKLEAADLTNTVTLPVKFQEDRFLVDAIVNGSVSARLLLDTGCTIVTLNPKIIDRLKIQPSSSTTMSGIAGEEKAPTYRGITIELNGASYAPSRVAAIPSEREHSRRRDGVLGHGFFRRFVVELDSKSGVVRLHPPSQFNYSGNGEIIPFRMRSSVPIVAATLTLPNKEKVKCEFEIDTGCDSGVCLGQPFIQKNKVLAQAETKDSAKFGVGGSVETKSGTLPLLALGQLEIKDVQTDFFGEGSPVDEPAAGHIGMGVFKDFKVIIDYSRNRMILER